MWTGNGRRENTADPLFILVDVVREGSFTHVKQLCDQILAYLAERNANPTRCVGKAKEEEILHKIHRVKQVLTV